MFHCSCFSVQLIFLSWKAIYFFITIKSRWSWLCFTAVVFFGTTDFPQLESNLFFHYPSQYLGSTHVKELRGTESTMKSIHKLRKAVEGEEGGGGNSIVLAISYQGVSFLDNSTKVRMNYTYASIFFFFWGTLLKKMYLKTAFQNSYIQR